MTQLLFHKSGTIEIKIYQEFKINDAFALLDTLYKDERYTEPTRVLFNMGSERIYFFIADIEELVAYVVKHRPHGEGRAAFLTNNETTYESCLIFYFLAKNLPIELEIFKDGKKAMNWLSRWSPAIPYSNVVKSNHQLSTCGNYL